MKKNNFFNWCGCKNKKDFIYVVSKAIEKISKYKKEEVIKYMSDITRIDCLLKKLWYQKYQKQNIKEFYNVPLYLFDVLNCFINFSYYSLSSINSKSFSSIVNKKQITSILDYGAGMGLTSIFLQFLFPHAKIYYCDLGKYNRAVFKILNLNFCKNKIININKNELKNKKFDMVVCLEFFEHFEKPLEFLEKNILIVCKKYLLETSSFSIQAPGHFDYYVHKNKKYKNKYETRKFFNKGISKYFKKIYIGWNARPILYEKK